MLWPGLEVINDGANNVRREARFGMCIQREVSNDVGHRDRS